MGGHSAGKKSSGRVATTGTSTNKTRPQRQKRHGSESGRRQPCRKKTTQECIGRSRPACKDTPHHHHQQHRKKSRTNKKRVAGRLGRPTRSHSELVKRAPDAAPRGRTCAAAPPHVSTPRLAAGAPQGTAAASLGGCHRQAASSATRRPPASPSMTRRTPHPPRPAVRKKEEQREAQVVDKRTPPHPPPSVFKPPTPPHLSPGRRRSAYHSRTAHLPCAWGRTVQTYAEAEATGRTRRFTAREHHKRDSASSASGEERLVAIMGLRGGRRA